MRSNEGVIWDILFFSYIILNEGFFFFLNLHFNKSACWHRIKALLTFLILEECWLAVRRLAVLLLLDISLHLHSGSQEAESQGNHSADCVIRMTNQSNFPVNLWHQIKFLLKYDSTDMGYWDRVFGYKEASLGEENL